MTRSLPDVLPRRRTDLMTADFETELVVLVPDRRRVLHLDEGLSIVLDSCDGETTAASLVEEVATATGDTAGQVERWLSDALDRLDDLALLDTKAGR